MKFDVGMRFAAHFSFFSMLNRKIECRELIFRGSLAYVTIHREKILSDDEIDDFQKMIEIHQKPI